MATISTYYRGDMYFETQLGNHTIGIDVPASMGGQDRSPTPPEYFVASLGSCVGAFVAQYCERNGVDVSGMTVDVDFEKTESPVRLTNIRVRVNMPHAECESEDRRRAAIQRVAEHCPVHETISHVDEISIDILTRAELEQA